MLMLGLFLAATMVAASPCTPLQRSAGYADYRSGVDQVGSRQWKSAAGSFARALRELPSSGICPEDNELRDLYETQSRIYQGLAADELGHHSQAVAAWTPLLRSSSDEGLLIRANGRLVQGDWSRAFDLYLREVRKNLGGQPGVDSTEVNAILARALSDAQSERFGEASSLLSSPSLRGVRYADYVAAIVRLRQGRRTKARALLRRVLTDENLIPSPGAEIIYDYVVQASIDLLSRLPPDARGGQVTRVRPAASAFPSTHRGDPSRQAVAHL